MTPEAQHLLRMVVEADNAYTRCRADVRGWVRRRRILVSRLRDLGVTQTEIAEALELSRQRIGQIEKGT